MLNMRGTHDNDNENPWSSIGLQAAMIVNRLRCQAQLLELQTDKKQNEQPSSEPNPGRAGEKESSPNREYVDQRLREIAAFERRVSGKN